MLPSFLLAYWLQVRVKFFFISLLVMGKGMGKDYLYPLPCTVILLKTKIIYININLYVDDA